MIVLGLVIAGGHIMRRSLPLRVGVELTHIVTFGADPAVLFIHAAGHNGVVVHIDDQRMGPHFFGTAVVADAAVGRYTLACPIGERMFTFRQRIESDGILIFSLVIVEFDLPGDDGIRISVDGGIVIEPEILLALLQLPFHRGIQADILRQDVEIHEAIGILIHKGVIAQIHIRSPVVECISADCLHGGGESYGV